MNRTGIILCIVALAACTPDDGDQSAVDPSLLEPQQAEQQLPDGALKDPDAELEELARAGRCEELQGPRLSRCLERAQYLPENAVGLPDDPGAIRRRDPEQPHLEPERRIGEHHDRGHEPRQRRDRDQGGDRSGESPNERRR